jgi:succinate dehydrogenase/fumarate reductase cytochrome b subunit
MGIVLMRVDFGGLRQMVDVRMMRACSALVSVVVLALLGYALVGDVGYYGLVERH